MTDDEVQLEDQWVREKAAKQNAARTPPPKSRKGLFIALAAIAVVATVIVAAVLLVDGDEQSSSPDRIKIELRANPTAEIRIDGKKVGKTPISVQFPRSDKEILIEATLVRHWVQRGGAKKDERFIGIRKVKANRDYLFDFTYKNTTLVETNKTPATDEERSDMKAGSGAKPAGSGAKP
jgi:hypothetical protein